jgi:hypothetical protein
VQLQGRSLAAGKELGAAGKVRGLGRGRDIGLVHLAAHAGRVGAGAGTGTGTQTIQIRPAVLAKGLQALAQRIECGNMQAASAWPSSFSAEAPGLKLQLAIWKLASAAAPADRAKRLMRERL